MAVENSIPGAFSNIGSHTSSTRMSSHSSHSSVPNFKCLSSSSFPNSRVVAAPIASLVNSPGFVNCRSSAHLFSDPNLVDVIIQQTGEVLATEKPKIQEREEDVKNIYGVAQKMRLNVHDIDGKNIKLSSYLAKEDVALFIIKGERSKIELKKLHWL